MMALNSAMSGYCFLELREMHKEHTEHKEIREMGLNSRELADKACPFCGGRKYQLVLRWDMQSHANGLIARCAQCQRVR